jgi:hypothetical protein
MRMNILIEGLKIWEQAIEIVQDRVREVRFCWVHGFDPSHINSATPVRLGLTRNHGWLTRVPRYFTVEGLGEVGSLKVRDSGRISPRCAGPAAADPKQTGLARLWRDQGKRAEARDLLAPVYNWFTEGFDTPVLQDAKLLLDQLSA